jgi:hypothetical protein
MAVSFLPLKFLNKAILQALSVGEEIEVLHNIHNNIPNQPCSSEQRNQSTQENSTNIQSTIDNLQSTESVVPVSPEAEKPNEAILDDNVSKVHVAQPPSAVFNSE